MTGVEVTGPISRPLVWSSPRAKSSLRGDRGSGEDPGWGRIWDV